MIENKFVSSLRIDEKRFRVCFDKLAAFGATPDGGVHRPALSEAHLNARQWFVKEARRAGFDTSVDGAGNHTATLNCGMSGGKTLFIGSHLDTVPCGGRFDGALGVAAALEVLRGVFH